MRWMEATGEQKYRQHQHQHELDFNSHDLSTILSDMTDVEGDSEPLSPRVRDGQHRPDMISIARLTRELRQTRDSTTIKQWIQKANERKRGNEGTRLTEDRNTNQGKVDIDQQGFVNRSSNERSSLSELDLLYALVSLPPRQSDPLNRQVVV